MIKAVIFDCFGVLVGKGFWHTYAAAGGDVEKDRKFVEDALYRANAGELDDLAFIRLIAGRLGISPEACSEVIDADEQPNLDVFEYIRTTLKPQYKIGF